MNPIFEKFVPEEFENIITYLEAWVEEHQVLRIASDACRGRLREYLDKKSPKKEFLKALNDSSVDIQFLQHSLLFVHRGLLCPHILTELSLHIEISDGIEEAQVKTLKIIGTYRYGLRLDRAFVSDFSNIFDNYK